MGEESEEDLCAENPFLLGKGFKPMKMKAIRRSASYKAAKLSVKRNKQWSAKRDNAKGVPGQKRWQGKIDKLDPSPVDAQKLMDQALQAKSCAAANRAARKGKKNL